MSRYSYKTVLRTRHIRPLPPPEKLRSSLTIKAPTIDATASAQQEKAA